MAGERQNVNKDKQFTILLLSAPIGSGHRLAAQALEEELAARPGVKVIHGNVFSFFPNILGTLFLRSYLLILARCPWLYKAAYAWGNKKGGSLWLRGLINRALAYLGGSYLRRVNPDAVLATHATPAGIMAIYKRSHPQLKLGAVITDFTIHRWWLCDGIDYYFIADELLKHKLPTTAQVLPFGIPVRRKFAQIGKRNAADLRRGLNWPADKKICLLMGGGEGLLPMQEIIAALNKAQIDNLMIVAVNGHNNKLLAKLQQKFSGAANIRLYGFTGDVPAMMGAADMIVTKAGGLTSAEVLATGLDFIIYHPLPGQEEGNAHFLSRHSGAVIAHKTDEVAQLVRQFTDCKNDDKLQNKENSYGKPNAAADICNFILNELEKN